MILKELMTITSHRLLAPRIYELKLSGQMVNDMQAGQFVHLLVPDASKVLRRPISIANIDKDHQEATLIYRVEGEGLAIISELKKGDQLDVMGPQGNGFNIAEAKAGEHVVIIGGGIGVPPLYETGKQLVTKGVKVSFLFGYATRDVQIYTEDFKALGDVKLATDDGSLGIKGHVGHLLNQLDFDPDAVYACGAPAMLTAVAKHFDGHKRTYISMEARMACGMGACYACVIPQKNASDPSKNLRVCEDGPVFSIDEVVL